MTLNPEDVAPDLSAQTADLRPKLVNAITYWCRCPADTTPVGMDGVCVDCGVRVDAAMAVFQPVLDKLQMEGEDQRAEIARLREGIEECVRDATIEQLALLRRAHKAEGMTRRLRTAWASARIGRAEAREESKADREFADRLLEEASRLRRQRTEFRARAESAETALTQRDMEIRQLNAVLAGLKSDRAASTNELLDLIQALTDPDDCWFDHNGGCQGHGYLHLKAGERCPHAEAKEWLAARTQPEEGQSRG